MNCRAPLRRISTETFRDVTKRFKSYWFDERHTYSEFRTLSNHEEELIFFEGFLVLPKSPTHFCNSFALQSENVCVDRDLTIVVHDTASQEFTPVQETCDTFEKWIETMDKQAMPQQKTKKMNVSGIDFLISFTQSRKEERRKILSKDIYKTFEIMVKYSFDTITPSFYWYTLAHSRGREVAEAEQKENGKSKFEKDV